MCIFYIFKKIKNPNILYIQQITSFQYQGTFHHYQNLFFAMYIYTSPKQHLSSMQNVSFLENNIISSRIYTQKIINEQTCALFISVKKKSEYFVYSAYYFFSISRNILTITETYFLSCIFTPYLWNTFHHVEC